MTLIFDSDEENSNQQNNDDEDEIIPNVENELLQLSSNQIKEEIEEDYFLNEDSYKIERGSSVHR